jgi:hypothetical protein
MIRHVSLPWPSLVKSSDGDRVRLLAVSDEPEKALDFERNRDAVGKIDAVLGCGDLEPDYLSYLADAFRAPLIYVRGNHDRGANWSALAEDLPEALVGRCDWIQGISLLGLSWPADGRDSHAIRSEQAAWLQALPLGVRSSGQRPLIVLSHVPPRGLGDTPEDHYHRGFAAYEWLRRRLHPTLWLHGHTSMATTPDWRVRWGETTLVNVTGAVVVELGGSS